MAPASGRGCFPAINKGGKIMRRSKFMPIMLSSFAFTACLLTGGAGRAAEPVEVVRLGDRQMSCAALAGEINALAQVQSPAAAKPRKKGGFGFLKVIGTAVPLVGIGNAMGGALLSSAAGAAQTAAAQGEAEGAINDSRRMAADAMAGLGPAEQRKARLTGIFEEKHC